MSSYILKGPVRKDKFEDESLGKILFDIIKKYGNQIAAIDGDTEEAFTYNETLYNSVKFARALRILGIKRNDIIAVVSENDTKCIIPILACLYLGVTLNMLNPAYTKRELINSFNSCNPITIISNGDKAKTIIEIKDETSYIKHIITLSGKSYPSTIRLDDMLEMAEANIDQFTLEVFEDNSEQIAFILNSSGTTGLPKGVMLSHKNVRCALNYFCDPECVNLNSNEKTIILLPMHHIFGLALCLGALVQGMPSIIMKKFIPEKFISNIEKYRVTKVFVVPSLAIFLAKTPLLDKYDLSSVTDVISSAAPLGAEIEKILEKRLHIRPRQAYGMTEATGCITVERHTALGPHGTSGQPVCNMEVKIIDIETSHALGPYQNGEICCRGDQIFYGYIGDEEATRNMIDEDKFMHTGDIGYYDNQGMIFIVDRLKELIKYKGFQVAPAELESILLSHKGVREAVVIGIPDERAGELPRAFVLKSPDYDFSENDLIEYVKGKVAVHKELHGGVEFVSEIPKSATGKVLRRVLRAIYTKK